jgi:hypothetical protein
VRKTARNSVDWNKAGKSTFEVDSRLTKSRKKLLNEMFSDATICRAAAAYCVGDTLLWQSVGKLRSFDRYEVIILTSHFHRLIPVHSLEIVTEDIFNAWYKTKEFGRE